MRRSRGRLLGIVLGSFLAACTHHGTASRTPTTLSPTPATTVPTTTIATVPGPPTFQVFDLWFVDAGHGWVLGLECPSPGVCRAGIRATDDGGRTWRKTGAPPVGISTADGRSSVSQIRFADRSNGFALGPSLFVTHDGGRSWAEGGVAGRVRALEAVGASVWALGEEPCPSGVCPVQLVVSSDFGRTWGRAPVQPPVPGSPGMLLRFGQNAAWLLSWNYGAGGSSGALNITRDGGRSWHELPNPCAAEYASDDQLATSDGAHLWLLCAGQPSAGQQLKTLHLSADGGASWSGPTDAPAYGYLHNLVGTSSSRGWLTLDRATLETTADGGKSWQQAIPIDAANPGDGSAGPVRFVDSHRGWVGIGGDVFRTVDGGVHWTRVVVPA